MKQHQTTLLGDLEVDLDARRVSRDGEQLALGKLSFDLLEELIRAAPAALSNEEIVDRVWAGDAVTDENIKQRVSLLRRALAEGSGPEYIETLRGFGYRLAQQPRSRSAPGTSAAPPPARADRLARRLLMLLAIVSLLLLITVLAIAARQLKRTRAGAVTEPASATRATLSVRAGICAPPGTPCPRPVLPARGG